ncbi:3-oxoacyl-[acyl-carrier protein] reductase [Azospirillum agricola]|uniref:glucose 1-dehydrogenase n=1 Tax=Azospirillum agricola TaxID=1720247 RepID=UPI001AE69B5E|nr:glucose 1-dehydrogenase [Azospirillum agricola]MBP2232892.1 3-oxoacyl-[acyl-carrier protein] reductase [Azospirillum agricola]
MTKRLDGKVALITGAAQGLGLAMAETFVREGARVAVVDINGDAARSVAESLGGNAVGIAANVTRAADVEMTVAATVEKFGRLDILVNNAGSTHANGPFEDVTEEEFDRVFALNVKSIYLYSKAVVAQMRAQQSGVILNLGSTAGLRPRPGLVWYNATKGAVHNITKSLALELAPDRIRVCALAPVATETPLLATFMGGDTPEKRARMLGIVPLGRLGKPSDVANAALYLASDEAEFLTGVVLEIDGGRCV